MRQRLSVVILALALLSAPSLGFDALLAPPVDPDPAPCPDGMARQVAYWGSFCIDRYEASDGGGRAASLPGRDPWTGINQEGARAACAAAGKRLCRDHEWMASCDIGGQRYDLVEEENFERHSCNTWNGCDYRPCPTGSRQGCRSAAGLYDMLGNVWEWTDASVPDGSWAGGDAYVGDVLGEPRARYGDDYVYRPSSDVAGHPFLRGGGWAGDIEFAPRRGCFSLYVRSPPGDRGGVFGFRCCAN